jgi:predicted PP-loop superfamily ATPase
VLIVRHFTRERIFGSTVNIVYQWAQMENQVTKGRVPSWSSFAPCERLSKELLEKVLNSMREDEIKLIVRSDIRILVKGFTINMVMNLIKFHTFLKN